MRVRTAVAVASMVVALAGCKKSADVSVSGTISGIQEGDSVFVTLSRDWDKGVVAPISFQIDREGRFALRIVISGTPSPVTFVKNNQALARLELKDAWGYAPVLVDRIGGKEFPVTVVSEGYLTAKVQLP
jgi:hypothetical protein